MKRQAPLFGAFFQQDRSKIARGSGVYVVAGPEAGPEGGGDQGPSTKLGLSVSRLPPSALGLRPDGFLTSRVVCCLGF
jgi:hypothetical protein